jgi:hypothetical protein
MSLDVSRLRRSDWMVGGGAVALFVFLFFFNWYGVSSSVGTVNGVSFGGSVSRSGWDTFTNSRWIWLITIVVAIGAVVLVAGQRKLDLPVRLSTLVLGLGALSTLLILYRIVHHPSGGASVAGASFSYGIKIGIWLGLIAAVAVTYGGYLMMSEEGASLSDLGHPPNRTVVGATPPTTPSSPATSMAPSTPSTPVPPTPVPPTPAPSTPVPSTPPNSEAGATPSQTAPATHEPPSSVPATEPPPPPSSAPGDAGL